MELTNVYNQLGILFTLMLFGYVLGKIKVLNEQIVGSFTSFIIKVTIPAMIINGMLIPLSREKLAQGAMAFAISLGFYLLTYIVAIYIPKMLTKDKKVESAYSFAIMFSNVGFMGYPVLAAIFGNDAIFIASIYNISFNVLLYTVGVKLAKGSNEPKEAFSPKLLINPGTVASLVGLILFITSPQLPEFLVGSIDAVGGLSTPLSMIAIGAMLSDLPIANIFGKVGIYILTSIRLLVLPIIVLVVLKFIFKIQDSMLVGIPVVIAGMPVASNAAMMLRQYDGDYQFASELILVSTLFSGITIPILVQML
ncbi:MAG: AEC family transporter [Cellulosilyticaceae bacterium]